MSKAWKNGSTTAWRKVRAAVLERDGYVCLVQYDEGCTGKGECAHHTLGREVTGDDPQYIISSCNYCNQKIGDPRKLDPPAKIIGWWHRD